MLELPVFDSAGLQTGTVSVDEADYGGRVRPQLLKQAVVMYQSRRRLGTAATRSRGEVEGSTRKLYRQKGTGNARMGNVRTVIRRGGGVAFAKNPRDFGRRMPKRMRRLACRNALLAKMTAQDVLIVDQLSLDAPRTKTIETLLTKLGARDGCLIALADHDAVVYRSSRNTPKTDVMAVADLNAYAVLRRKKVVFTRDAFEKLASGTVAERE